MMAMLWEARTRRASGGSRVATNELADGGAREPGSQSPAIEMNIRSLLVTIGAPARSWSGGLSTLWAVVATGLLLVVGCGDPPSPRSLPPEDSAVQQPAFVPRRAPTLASPSPTPATATTATPSPQVTPSATVARDDTGPNRSAFVQVGTGRDHVCAVRSDGSAKCWGGNDDRQLDVPSEVRFRQIASGWRYSCGVTTVGTLACWGRNDHQQANPPDGQFTQVAAGWDHACAIGPDGAACWGRQADDRAAVPSEVALTAIGAGAEHSCGLTAEADLTCWGKNDNGRADSRPGPFRALAVGIAHTCVLRLDGTALCQGQSTHGRSEPPATAYDHISAGDHRTCGTLATGQVECWDARPTGTPIQTFGPPGAYTSVSVGWYNACAVNEVGQIGCWSSGPDPLPEPFDRLLVANAIPEIELSQPVELISWPYGGLAVADKTGSIAVLSSEFGSEPVLDLTDVVFSDTTEAGMLSMAIAPDFDSSPFLYVYYSTQDKNDDDRLFARLSRFPVADGIVARQQEMVILEIPRTTQSELHWGGAIRFGPDGMLYLGIGDSQCAECPQNLNSLHGKIIRIDVREASADEPYRIPNDNPQWNAPNALPEVWAYGLRNPWRMAFDPQDGRLWVGDVGHHGEEEVSIVTAGANLGWPYFEGYRCIGPDIYVNSTDIDPKIVSARLCQDHPEYSGFELPIVSYTHLDGCAIVGGIVYRGSSIQSLKGAYLFGDYCRGRVFALDGDADVGWRLFEVADLNRPLSSFGIDADGEVFMLTFGNPLVRLVKTQVGYAPSVIHRVRVTTFGPPLDTGIAPTFGDRKP